MPKGFHRSSSPLPNISRKWLNVDGSPVKFLYDLGKNASSDDPASEDLGASSRIVESISCSESQQPKTTLTCSKPVILIPARLNGETHGVSCKNEIFSSDTVCAFEGPELHNEDLFDTGGDTEESSTTESDSENFNWSVPEIVQDPALYPRFLKELEDISINLNLPPDPIRLHRKLIRKFLGGGDQGSYIKIGKNQKDLSKEFNIREFFSWKEGGEPLFPSGPGKHGAAITFALHLADGRVIHENGPASALRNHPLREVVTFMRHKPCQWYYMGIYRHGREYEQLIDQEFKALRTDDKLWWLRVLYPSKDIVWGAKMFVDAGLVTKKEHVKKRFSEGRLYDMMHKPDPETGTQIVFYWRYMECVGFDTKFYERLIEEAGKVDFKYVGELYDTNWDWKPHQPNYRVVLPEGYIESEHSEFKGDEDSESDSDGDIAQSSAKRRRLPRTRMRLRNLERLRQVVEDGEDVLRRLERFDCTV